MKVFWKINKLAKDAASKFNRFGHIFVFLSFLIIFIADIAAGSQHDVIPNIPNNFKVKKNMEPLTYLSVRDSKIINQKGKEIRLRGVHYDCFYVLPKKINDALKRFGENPDKWNIELSKYFFTDNDIAQLKNLGINVVRLELRLWEIEKKPYIYSQTALAHLDDTIARLGQNGIYVIIDLHAAGQNSLNHNKEYGNKLWQDKDLQNRVISLWGVIANRYSNYPCVAGYDIINEPQAPAKKALHSFYQECINEIRKNDKKHMLFIEVNLGENMKILFGGEYDDPNIVLSFHFYKPHEFTSQGKRGKPDGLKYPAQYGDVYWDKTQIDKFFAQVLAMKRSRKRPFFVGEFSANLSTGGQYALKWTKDVIDVMNSKGIHYTYFCYKFSMSGSLGYYTPRKGVCRKLNVLMKKIMEKGIRFKDLLDEEKKYFLTENFESSRQLKQILENGFKGCLTE